MGCICTSMPSPNYYLFKKNHEKLPVQGRSRVFLAIHGAGSFFVSAGACCWGTFPDVPPGTFVACPSLA